MAFTEWELRRAALGQDSIHILLCDDDPVFLQELQRQIRRVFAKMGRALTVVSYDSPARIEPKRLETCDMAFMDIDFEGDEENGIGIARRLRERNRHACVFFVTNYIDYAPAGYEVQAFRYILKRDLEEVLERYILQALDSMAQSREHLRLRDREQTVDLPLEHISYLEVLDHYVSIHTDTQSYTLHATLSGMETEMQTHGFLRIHKSYLVNMRCIRKFRSRECLLNDGTALAVSEKNYSQQKQKFLLWKGREG